MKRSHAPWALGLLLAASGCAGGTADGGPVGTGIIASVAGNVIDVDASAQEADTASDGSDETMPVVEVSIDELPETRTTTDAEGNFSLEGEFAGPLTVRFAAAGLEATQVVVVPAGSLVVLSDVSLRPGEAEPEAGRQLDFVGRLAAVDCPSSTLRVADERAEPEEFEVQLLPETHIVRRDGAELGCSDLHVGETLGIEGSVALDGRGSITALEITVAARRASRPGSIDDVPLLGHAAAVDCVSGFLTIADAGQRTRLRLASDTAISAADGTAARCDDLRIGDRLAGAGRLRVSHPGTIQATRLRILRSAAPGTELRLLGVVVEADCPAALLRLTDRGARFALRLLPETIVRPALDCADIRPGDRVRGKGRIGDRSSDAIDAVELRVRQASPGRDARRPAAADSQG